MRAYLRSLDPRLSRATWVLLSGSFANAFGNGVVFRFVLIYLHNVRRISVGTAGIVLAAMSAAGLVAGLAVGAIVDRVGARAMLAASMVLSIVYVIASYDGGLHWTPAQRVNDNEGPTEALQPNLAVTPTGRVAVGFYDRRLSCPAAGTTDAAAAGLQYDPNHPYGAQNYCINTAIQFYTWNLTPIGHNVRLSAHTWDPQLSSPHPYGIADSTTFIGDYFGNDASVGANDLFTFVSTYDDGSNPAYRQQQVVAALATP